MRQQPTCVDGHGHMSLFMQVTMILGTIEILAWEKIIWMQQYYEKANLCFNNLLELRWRGPKSKGFAWIGLVGEVFGAGNSQMACRCEL